MTARYPVDSKFHITASFDNKSYISKSYYAQPLKMMRGFEWGDDGVKVIMMTSAPGLLDGDHYDISLTTEENAKLWITAQSYEKIYTSIGGNGSSRDARINVAKNSYLRYTPLPTIPYKDSIFNSRTVINLEDSTSMFSMLEVLTGGRIAKSDPEVFEYTEYRSLVDVIKGGELIYRDNTRFKPKESVMSGYGMYEGYTHLGNLLIVNFDINDGIFKELNEIIADNKEIEGGMTRLQTNDILIRFLGTSGQTISEFGDLLIEFCEQKKKGNE